MFIKTIALGLAFTVIRCTNGSSEPLPPIPPIPAAPTIPAMPAMPAMPVISVQDGDTITVTTDDKKTKVRLCGIDAPELSQDLGEEAKQTVIELIDDQKGYVVITKVDTDRYSRLVGEVSFIDGTSLNESLVRLGMAYVYPQYVNGCNNAEELIEAEKLAKANNLGVHKANLTYPWDYRRSK